MTCAFDLSIKSDGPQRAAWAGVPGGRGTHRLQYRGPPELFESRHMKLSNLDAGVLLTS